MQIIMIWLLIFQLLLVHVDSEVPEATVDGKVERDEEEDGDDPVDHQVQVDNVHLTRRPHVLFLFDKEQALNFPLTVTVTGNASPDCLPIAFFPDLILKTI